MPALSDITIKKNDGVTDITWTGDVPSSGNKSPARYSSKTVSTIPAFQPKLAIASAPSGDGRSRKVTIDLLYPHTATDSTTGLTSEVSRLTFHGTWSVPQDIPTTVVDEYVSQLGNLIDSPAVVAQLKVQQAAT
jgi:hypothetical protein